MNGYPDWVRGLVYGAVVNSINLKKTLRSDVKPRLERIERKLDELLSLMRDSDGPSK